MRLILDLSPMLVNRTAAFQIGRAVMDALSDQEAELQYFGRPLAKPPSDIEALELRMRLTEALGLEETPKLPPQDDGPQSGTRRVFLDPLYVLFSHLTPQDVVLVHDLSPVTTPKWHDPAVARLYTAALREIARTGPQLLAVSHNTARTYHANYGYPTRPIKVIHLFVPEHSAPSATRMQASRPYVLFVGSLEARKNISGAIEAFHLSGLERDGYDLVIVGGGGHGSELALRAAAGVPGVRFAGFVDDAEMAALYAGAAVFLYPSYLEGFGVPLLEALAHGVPSVASVTGACPEVGGDLVPCCDPDDHAAIAAELRTLSAMSPADRREFGRRARARVSTLFHPDGFKVAFRAAALAE